MNRTTLDYAQLRELLKPLITDLKGVYTHAALPGFCEKLGLPDPAADGSKRDRIAASFDAAMDSDLPEIARKFLKHHPPLAGTRNQIQDLLWNERAFPAIPKRCRHEVARQLNDEVLYGDAHRFDALRRQGARLRQAHWQ